MSANMFLWRNKKKNIYLLHLRSVLVSEWLMFPTFDHEVRGTNHAGVGIQLMTVGHFVAQSLSISPYHCIYDK